MSLYSHFITLLLVLNPFSNIPVFLSILQPFPLTRKLWIAAREAFFAFLILSFFLFFGQSAMGGLNISEPALSISGGILLFLIALRMIFPNPKTAVVRDTSEPFLVPLAIPLCAGPSSIATVILLSSRFPDDQVSIFFALFLASMIMGAVLVAAQWFRRWISQRMLTAIERLMGMLLTTIAVQMLLNGIELFIRRSF